ncbi:conserved hypothetical protein [Paraburkholderia ribeironis]|uniref:Uncharacterized protein n=1 Tax=Paraburkholderia ribeironis TaxID=1247936 RepID=A0A1N7SDA5_9BURK|nr:hypothetical protein [Paraburkholderia ribeironis]SIT45343.1 conserved hypothetical protein [Paraburkholderia ribeironis]
MQDIDYTLIALGGLHLPRELKLEKGLADNVPILTCPLELPDLVAIRSQGPGTCFGYGSMQVDDARILTFRLQLGGVQIYWLADLTDAEVWTAMDLWQKQQFVPFAFQVEKRLTICCKAEIGSKAPIIGQFRNQICADAPAEMWDILTDTAASGWVHQQASTDIPGVPLEHVLVNVLVTKRYEALVKGKTFAHEPTVATAGSGGASNIH